MRLMWPWSSREAPQQVPEYDEACDPLKKKSDAALNTVHDVMDDVRRVQRMVEDRRK